MTRASRIHPFATLAIIVACPLLSAAVFGALAIGIAAIVGASHVFAIGSVVAALVGVVNASALCLALSVGEGAAPAEVGSADAGLESYAYARAS